MLGMRANETLSKWRVLLSRNVWKWKLGFAWLVGFGTLAAAALVDELGERAEERQQD